MMTPTWESVQVIDESPPIKSSRISAIISAGDFVIIDGYKNSFCSSNVGRVVDVSYSRPNGPWVRLNWWVGSKATIWLQANVIANPSNKPLPKELVQSSQSTWIPAAHIAGIAFIFLASQIEVERKYVFSVGMSNAFVYRYRWDCISHSLEVVDDHIPFWSRRDDNLHAGCFPFMGWSSLERIRKEMQKIMCRVAMTQKLTIAIRVPIERSAWNWLKSRIHSEVEAKKGVFTTNILDTNLIFESIKMGTRKERVVMESDAEMLELQLAIGAGFLVGIRCKPPKAPKKIGIANSYSACHGDDLNVLLELDEHHRLLEVDYDHLSQRRGIVFSYDYVMEVLRIQIKKLHVRGSNHCLQEYLGMPTPENADTKFVNDEEGVGALTVQVGNRFLYENALCTIRKIDGNNVRSTVVRSTNNSLPCGRRLQLLLDDVTNRVHSYCS
jgi:hypothetical protein